MTDRLQDRLPPDAATPSPRRRLLRYLGFALALALLAGSIFFAGREGDFSALKNAQPEWVAALLAAMALSAVLVNGFLFWLVNKPYADPQRPVRLNDMHALIAASGLLNYTPVKAGLLGRVAYLKKRHGVGYKASLLIHTMVAGAMFAAYLAVVVITALRPRLDTLWWIALLLAMPAAAAVGCALVQRALPRHQPGESPEHAADADALQHSLPWTFAHLLLWIAVAMANVFFTGARWFFVGQIMDQPLPPRDALLMAVLHNLASVLPANGLGAREWLVGLLFGGTAPADFMSLALVDRAAEAVILVPTGLLALVYLHRRGLRLRTRQAEALPEPDRPT